MKCTGIWPLDCDRAGERVCAVEALDADRIRSLIAEDAHRDGRAFDRLLAGGVAGAQPVVAVRPADDHGVGGAVTGSVERLQVDMDALDVGAGEVADGGGVGAAEGADVDVFDVVGVHGDGGDVAGEAEAVAVGGELDLFGGVGAVEVECVVAGLAFDGVAAVAGVPLEVVVAGAEEGGVGSDVAVDVVVAFAAVQGVCSVAAAEVVVAVAALQGECGDGGEAVLAGDRVVAVEAGDDQAFDGWVDEGGCGAGCEDGCFGGVACDADLVGLVAAVVAGGVFAVAAGEVHRDLAAGLRPSW